MNLKRFTTVAAAASLPESAVHLQHQHLLWCSLLEPHQ
jgi:hypothetical protein